MDYAPASVDDEDDVADFKVVKISMPGCQCDNTGAMT
jgi:hypothetical protein